MSLRGILALCSSYATCIKRLPHPTALLGSDGESLDDTSITDCTISESLWLDGSDLFTWQWAAKSTHSHSRSNHPPISYKCHAANMCLDTHNIVIFSEQTSLQSLMLLSAWEDMRILLYEWPFSRSKRHIFIVFALLVLVKYHMMIPNVLVLPDTK